MADGEVNLIGGILQDSESHSLSGYPWLTKIPILKYLFGQENKDRQQNEIVFAITPHIIRSNEVNDGNERMVDVGSGNAVQYRSISTGAEETKPADKAPAQPPAPTAPAKASNTNSATPPL